MAGPGLDLEPVMASKEAAVLPSHERLIRNEAVVELIRNGDILKINVGGGGGHRLIRIPQYFCE